MRNAHVLQMDNIASVLFFLLIGVFFSDANSIYIHSSQQISTECLILRAIVSVMVRRENKSNEQVFFLSSTEFAFTFSKFYHLNHFVMSNRFLFVFLFCE